MGINGGLIENAIEQAWMVLSQVLQQNLPHITLSMPMTDKKNRVRILNGLNQKVQILKVKWSILTG
jgi:hypothetical protein